jgi:hypothetical protein
MATSLHHGSNIGIHDKNMFGPCRNAVQILLKSSQLFLFNKNPPQVFQLAVARNMGIYQFKIHERD